MPKMGNFANLRSGSPADAFSDLTGCPVEMCDFRDYKDDKAKDVLFQLLMKSDKQKCVMAASKQGEDKFTETGETPDNKIGLVPGHAYSLIEVREETVHGKPVRLIKLRNPWGRFEWNGEWGDKSPLWTDEAKKKFKPELKDEDGCFYMPYRLFLLNFDHVDICYASNPKGDAWQQQRAGGSFAHRSPFLPTNFYELKLSHDANVFVSIFQADQRVPGSPAPIDFGVVVLDEHHQPVLFTKLDSRNRINASSHLKHGTYTLIPLSSGCHLGSRTAPSPFVIGVHSDADFKLGSKSASLHEYNQAKIETIKKFGSNQTWDGHIVSSLSTSGWSGFAVTCGTERKITAAEFTLDFSSSTGVISNSGSLVSVQKLKPGEAALFMELSAADPKKGYGFSYKSKCAYFQ